MNITLLPLLSAAALLLPLPVFAQFHGPALVTASAAAKISGLPAGSKGMMTVTLTVKPAYHINANKPNDPAYIPTVFTPQPAPGITYGTVHYPAARPLKVSYSPKPLLVYQGRVVLTVPFTVSKAIKPGPKQLTGTVAYQACNAQSCFPPASAPVKAALMVK